ncbi:MAG TPA: MFS transporter, partial [Acidobacteriota bacterium]
FGVGLIIGPFLGGVLSQISLSLPFWFVGGLALGNVILAFFNLPETNQNRDKEKKISFNPFRPIARAMGSANLRPGFLAWFLFGLAVAGQQAVLSLYLAGAFRFNSFQISLVMVGTGIILVLNQAYFLKQVWLRHFSEEKLIIYFLFAIFGGFLLMGASFIFTLLAGLVLYSVAQSTLRVVMTSRITKIGDAREQGMILGMLSSVMSLSMIIGPVLAGALFSLAMNLPFWAGSLFSLLAFVIILCQKKRKRLAAAELSAEALAIAEQKIEFSC